MLTGPHFTCLHPPTPPEKYSSRGGGCLKEGGRLKFLPQGERKKKKNIYIYIYTYMYIHTTFPSKMPSGQTWGGVYYPPNMLLGRCSTAQLAKGHVLLRAVAVWWYEPRSGLALGLILPGIVRNDLTPQAVTITKLRARKK